MELTVSWAIVIVLAGAIAALAWLRSGTRERQRRLEAWAVSVPLTDAQRRAMAQLWACRQARSPPTEDPLSALTTEELERLIVVCGAEYRPAHFGTCNVLRIAAYEAAREQGFSAEQSAVLVGMTFNRVGFDFASD